MQENRSFDSYFGTFPGADGIPMLSGVPAVCVPDPELGRCVAPYHDSADLNRGGPHCSARRLHATSTAGGWTGSSRGPRRRWAPPATRRGCRPVRPTGPTDVMGYHDQREIPNYWAYATNFVLQDHMFEPNASWSLPAHLFMVSEWSAKCSQVDDPMSCTNELDRPAGSRAGTAASPAQLRLDRPHLPAAQGQRELEVLCGGGHRARLRRRRR